MTVRWFIFSVIVIVLFASANIAPASAMGNSNWCYSSYWYRCYYYPYTYQYPHSNTYYIYDYFNFVQPIDYFPYRPNYYYYWYM